MKRKGVDKALHVGIDEAGRGPLAGPMVIAAVMGVSSRDLKGIRDSKKLSPKVREDWFRLIKKKGVAEYVVIPPKNIDRYGMTLVGRKGIEQLLKKFPKKSHILLDGGLKAPQEYSQETIIKGDEKIPLIAAASIIAKVTRDRMMVRLAKKYPYYGFAIHKGYGTKAHMASIEKHGLSDIHRRLFCKRFL